MSRDRRDALEVLKFELSFLEHGGYGRSPQAPWRSPHIFQDSPSCLNFNDPARPHACEECLLIDFVPHSRRNADVPCHAIPLNASGETVLDVEQNQAVLEEKLAGWLRAAIAKLEQELAVKAR